MKSVPTFAAAAAATALVVLCVSAQDATYVGAAKCQVCHRTDSQGRQYPIWEASLHAKSFANLATPKAAEIAKPRGIADPSASPACLGCHAPLAAKAPELRAEGVSCEVCHGPGSAYKKLSIMKDKAEAAKNGLILYPDRSAIQSLCLRCHQNAHPQAFDFDASWAKIKHPVPGK
ncbi:MAG TPA: multiheme c-type cytochrome [Burkholderiales bacterium]|nr:multiheme c-type cytochrome [Burkholderiales bacterium]